MKPVIRVNSTSIRQEKDAVKFFSFRKPKESIETSFENVVKKTTKDANESKKTNSHISQDVTEYIQEFPKGENNIIVNPLVQNQLRWTHADNGFNSLPCRGSRKSKGPGTKVLINSDTVSQTKTLIYKDHQKSPNHCFLGHNDIEASPFNSFDSLNSSNDPDIVAALDQIASTLGLIDEEVLRTSDDPVNYLLNTRSFSEKISIHRNSPCNSGRVQSLYDQRESSRKKLDNQSLSKYPTTPVSTKKDSSFRKMMQRLSPKLLHRTKSSSSTIINYSSSTFYKDSKVKDKSKKNTNEQSKMVDSINTNKCGELSPLENPRQRTIYSQKEQAKDHNIIDDNSKRIFNSLRIDRVEDPHLKFRHNSKRQSNVPKCDDHDLPVEFSKSMLTEADMQGPSLLQSYPPFEKTQTLPSPSYINISISAFGYGPSTPFSSLPPSRRLKYQAKDDRAVTHILNASGDQRCSTEKDIDRE